MTIGAKIKAVIPGPVPVIREGFIVLGGIILAAFVISRFPSVQKWIQSNSLTVKSQNGDVLF